MTRRVLWLSMAVSSLALVAGCSSSSSSSSLSAGSSSPATTGAGSSSPTSAAAGSSSPSTAAAGSSSPAATPAGPATIQVATTSLGKVLTDARGMTLYTFGHDTPGSGKSACNGGCAAAWPPLTASGTPSAGAGLDATKLGTITRDDGTVQVTFAGGPLYHFAADAAPGDVKGEGVAGIWFAAGPDGKPVKPKAAAPSGNGY